MSLMGWLGWILLGVLLLWFLQSMKFSQGKRLNIRNYVIYLLLSDQIREDHKQKFQGWILESNAEDAVALGHQAHDVIEVMADGLAEGGSILAATGMIWKFKAGEWQG